MKAVIDGTVRASGKKGAAGAPGVTGGPKRRADLAVDDELEQQFKKAAHESQNRKPDLR